VAREEPVAAAREGKTPSCHCGVKAILEITYCPPASSTTHIDISQFALRRSAPVSARYMGSDRWETPGVSFGDYNSMQTSSRKLQRGRRFKAPSWALNDADLQLVIVSYLENRAFSKKRRKSCRRLSLKSRLLRVEAKLRSLEPSYTVVLDRLAAEYIELRSTGGDPARVRVLGSQIQTVDQGIVFNRTPASLTAAICYSYFREGRSSCEIASEYGVKSPAVRQILMKISQVAESLGFPAPEPVTNQKRDRTEERRALSEARRLAREHAKEEKRKVRRAARRAQGLCTSCGGPQTTPGFVRCEDCQRRETAAVKASQKPDSIGPA
jgi:hypothetical protein